jgi:hypothetical protein
VVDDEVVVELLATVVEVLDVEELGAVVTWDDGSLLELRISSPASTLGNSQPSVSAVASRMKARQIWAGKLPPETVRPL